MSSETLPVAIPDLSSFARALGQRLHARHAERPEPPGHVEILNLVARALGHRNVQSLRAALRTPRASRASAEAPAPLSANARKALALRAFGGGDLCALRVVGKRVPDRSQSGDGPNQSPPIECFRLGGYLRCPENQTGVRRLFGTPVTACSNQRPCRPPVNGTNPPLRVRARAWPSARFEFATQVVLS